VLFINSRHALQYLPLTVVYCDIRYVWELDVFVGLWDRLPFTRPAFALAKTSRNSFYVFVLQGDLLLI